MATQQRREQPEYSGKSQGNRPEMPAPKAPRPEIKGRDEPGTPPETPANVDRVHEPAGIDPRTDRTKQR